MKWASYRVGITLGLALLPLAIRATGHAAPAAPAALAPVAGSAAAVGNAPGSQVARFALVIGNNLPERPSEARLHYADDDALAMHRLLVEAGLVSRLLLRADASTRSEASGADAPRPPTTENLRRAVDELAQAMQSAEAAGARTELLVFYSGHGNVAHGEGYVLLEDGRLTRGKLYGLVERLAAGRTHLLVDACKSSFLAFEKGPGGKRTPFPAGFAKPDSARGGRTVGLVLSTSSGRESHEWERYQAGVFSHLLRSALRGAADVDRDGRITYAELGAFLARAGQAIQNPRYRPDFQVRPPGSESLALASLLSWRRQGAPSLAAPT